MRRFLLGRPFTVFVAFTIASLALAFDCQRGARAACVRPAHSCEDMPVMSCGCCDRGAGRESPATPAAARVQPAPLPTVEPAAAPGQYDLVDAEVRNVLYWCFQHAPRTPDLPTFLSTLLI